MVDQLDEDQVAEIKEAFTLFDKNEDGTIATKRLGTALRSLGINVSEAELEFFAQDVDPEKSGKVEFPAFLALVADNIKDINSEEEVREAFRVFDKDLKGTIPADEFFTIMTTMGDKFTDAEANEIIKEGDLLGQRKIHYEDLVTIMAGCINMR